MSFIQYMKDVRAEGERVTWPTRRVAASLTVIVIAISLAVAAYLGLLDFLFTKALENLL